MHNIVRSITTALLLSCLSYSCFGLPISSLLDSDFLPSKQQTKTLYEKSYNQGLEATQNQDFWKAEAHFNTALKEYSDYLPAKLGLVNVYLNTQRNEKAEALILELYEKHPDDEYVLTTYGKYMSAMGDLALAKTALEKVVLIQTQKPSYFINLADFYLNKESGQEKKAVEGYKTAIDIDPKHAGAHYGLAVAYSRLKKFGLAEEYFNEAARLAPNNPLPFLSMADMYMGLSDFQKAKKHFEAALARDDSSVAGQLGLGDANANLGDSLAAIKIYRKLKNSLSTDPRAVFRLAVEYQKLKRWTAAINEYENVIKLDPNNSIALNNLAWILAVHLNEPEKAVIWAAKATEVSPNVPGFHDTLGVAYMGARDLQKAEKAFRNAINLNAQYQPAYLNLAKLMVAKKRDQEASVLLKKAILLNKDSPEGKEAAKLMSSYN